MARANRAKNFVVEHQTGILITALVITAGAVVLTRYGNAQHNAFLRQKGLYEEFYDLIDE